MRRLIMLISLAVLAAACSGPAGPVSPSAPVPSSSNTIAEPTTIAESTTSTTAATPDVLAPYLAALEQTIGASSYRYKGTVQFQTQSGVLTLDLAGWVNGSERELVVTSGGQETVTSVKDGVATVTGPSGTSTIPVGEAAGVPSLSLLEDLRAPELTATGEVSGVLVGAVLEATGFPSGTSAGSGTRAIVSFDPGGTITGYTLFDEAHTWQMAVRLFDVGKVGA